MHRFRLSVDDDEESSRRTRRDASVLLPVLHRAFADTKMSRKFLLRHADLPPNGFHIESIWNMDTVLVHFGCPFCIG